MTTTDNRVTDERRAEHEGMLFTIVEHNKDERLTEKTLRFIDDLLADIDADGKRIRELESALEHLAEVADIAPEPNCSCHISPPCGDCVEWSGLREGIAEARAAISKANGAE